jgi:hypothetical protein
MAMAAKTHFLGLIWRPFLRQESRKTDTGAGDAHLMCSWLSGGLPDMKKEMAVDEKSCPSTAGKFELRS